MSSKPLYNPIFFIVVLVIICVYSYFTLRLLVFPSLNFGPNGTMNVNPIGTMNVNPIGTMNVNPVINMYQHGPYPNFNSSSLDIIPIKFAEKESKIRSSMEHARNCFNNIISLYQYIASSKHSKKIFAALMVEPPGFNKTINSSEIVSINNKTSEIGNISVTFLPWCVCQATKGNCLKSDDTSGHQLGRWDPGAPRNIKLASRFVDDCDDDMILLGSITTIIHELYHVALSPLYHYPHGYNRDWKKGQIDAARKAQIQFFGGFYMDYSFQFGKFLAKANDNFYFIQENWANNIIDGWTNNIRLTVEDFNISSFIDRKYIRSSVDNTDEFLCKSKNRLNLLISDFESLSCEYSSSIHCRITYSM